MVIGWGPATAFLNRIHDRLGVRISSADPGKLLKHRWNSQIFSWIRRPQNLELFLDVEESPLIVMNHNKKIY